VGHPRWDRFGQLTTGGTGGFRRKAADFDGWLDRDESGGSSPDLSEARGEIPRAYSAYLSSRFLLWYFGPVALAIATLLVPLVSLGIRRGMLLNMTPFLTLIVIWIVSVFVIGMRQRRELQREIDELSEIEKVNR
jgi:hypothetical protein